MRWNTAARDWRDRDAQFNEYWGAHFRRKNEAEQAAAEAEKQRIYNDWQQFGYQHGNYGPYRGGPPQSRSGGAGAGGAGAGGPAAGPGAGYHPMHTPPQNLPGAGGRAGLDGDTLGGPGDIGAAGPGGAGGGLIKPENWQATPLDGLHNYLQRSGHLKRTPQQRFTGSTAGSGPSMARGRFGGGAGPGTPDRSGGVGSGSAMTHVTKGNQPGAGAGAGGAGAGGAGVTHVTGQGQQGQQGQDDKSASAAASTPAGAALGGAADAAAAQATGGQGSLADLLPIESFNAIREILADARMDPRTQIEFMKPYLMQAGIEGAFIQNLVAMLGAGQGGQNKEKVEVTEYVDGDITVPIVTRTRQGGPTIFEMFKRPVEGRPGGWFTTSTPDIPAAGYTAQPTGFNPWNAAQNAMGALRSGQRK